MSGSVSFGVTSFTGALVHPRFYWSLPRVSVSPSPVEVLWSNPADLQTWGFPFSLPDPQIGKSDVGARTFTAVWKLLWYNCSPVCGVTHSSPLWSSSRLYGRANGDLFKEDLLLWLLIFHSPSTRNSEQYWVQSTRWRSVYPGSVTRCMISLK